MKSTFYIIAITALLFSCNISTKGSWTAEDKEKARTDLSEGKADMEAAGMDFDAWADCVIEKCEQNYSSYTDADSDLAGCEAIGTECMKEILGSSESTAGNWSEEDIKIMENTMNELRAEDPGNSDLDAFYDCYSAKLMATYDSFIAADQDGTGCAELSEECMTELGIEF